MIRGSIPSTSRRRLPRSVPEESGLPFSAGILSPDEVAGDPGLLRTWKLILLLPVTLGQS